MDKQQILQKLEEIFKDVLEVDEVDLKDETKASDIEEWDSINHIYLIVEIEKAFKIKFTTHEIQTWKNVGEMISTIQTRLDK